MKHIVLKKGEEITALRGSPWVWRDEIDRVAGDKGESAELAAGEIAEVETSKREYIGRAFVNPYSKIIARIFSPSKEGVDGGFFKRRIRQAFDRRRLFYDFSRDSFRAVFSEADFLPGLIIDRFLGWPLKEELNLPFPLDFDKAQEKLGAPSVCFSVQFLSYAMDARRDMILGALQCDENCSFIYEKSSSSRELEGLPESEGWLRGAARGGFLIFENSYPFIIDFGKSQKTGHFLDQSKNRKAAGVLIDSLIKLEKRDAPFRVLDCFCYTGGFSIHAARAGALVTAADSSRDALSALMKNALFNGLTGSIQTIERDCFELLTELRREKARFNAVILDPPAFAKTYPSKNAAVRGYREINKAALQILEEGGLLITSSCSGAVDEWLFSQIIKEAALSAGCRLHLIERRGQAPDHPVLLGHNECQYLKCMIYRVI